jgi:cytochrome oxidase assembly protein ShyY1
VRYFPVADLLADMKSDAPSYDAQTKTISVLSDITERGEVVKKLLLVVRFHEKGLATFYFYAPIATFAESMPVFNQVLASFRSGGAEQMLPHETLKVADIEDAKTDGTKSSRVIWYGLAAVLIIALMVVRRKRRQNR